MTDAIDDEIRDAGERWVRAELAGDTEALSRMVTDNFRLVGPFGFVLDKEQWLDRYRSGDLVTSSMTWRDIDARRHGDTVITIATQSQHAAYKGAPSNGDFRVSHTFVRSNNHWIIAHIQFSPTVP